MGFQFRKRIKLLPGLTLNVSGKGLSTSIGGDGVTVNYGRAGTRTTLSAKGTGLRYVRTAPMRRPTVLPNIESTKNNRAARRVAALLWIVLVGVLAYVLR
jgi:hypothetical protein